MNTRPRVTTPRSELRIADLKTRPSSGTKIMNVKLPNQIADTIDEMARTLNTSKQSVVVALLNEGVAAVGKMRRTS